MPDTRREGTSVMIVLFGGGATISALAMRIGDTRAKTGGGSGWRLHPIRNGSDRCRIGTIPVLAVCTAGLAAAAALGGLPAKIPCLAPGADTPGPAGLAEEGGAPAFFCPCGPCFLAPGPPAVWPLPTGGVGFCATCTGGEAGGVVSSVLLPRRRNRNPATMSTIPTPSAARMIFICLVIFVFLPAHPWKRCGHPCLPLWSDVAASASSAAHHAAHISEFSAHAGRSATHAGHARRPAHAAAHTSCAAGSAADPSIGRNRRLGRNDVESQIIGYLQIRTLAGKRHAVDNGHAMPSHAVDPAQVRHARIEILCAQAYRPGFSIARQSQMVDRADRIGIGREGRHREGHSRIEPNAIFGLLRIPVGYILAEIGRNLDQARLIRAEDVRSIELQVGHIDAGVSHPLLLRLHPLRLCLLQRPLLFVYRLLGPALALDLGCIRLDGLDIFL